MLILVQPMHNQCLWDLGLGCDVDPYTTNVMLILVQPMHKNPELKKCAIAEVPYMCACTLQAKAAAEKAAAEKKAAEQVCRLCEGRGLSELSNWERLCVCVCVCVCVQ